MRETPPLLAVIVTAVAEATVDVMMVNALLDDPTGTVTLPGTVATAGLLLVRVTVAAVLTDPVIVTVPEPDAPPVTALGLTETELSVCPGFSPGGGGLTFSVAKRSIPPADAPTEANRPCVGSDVVAAVKVTLVAPAGTVTVAGTRTHRVSLLESVTTVPPAGAGPPSVTVPVEPPDPTAVVGLNARPESPPAGSTSRIFVCIELRVAMIVTGVFDATPVVVIVNVALLAPCGMVTDAGTEATAGLVLPRCTIAPPGPGTKPMPPNVTVPVIWPPPWTVGALSASVPSTSVGSDGRTCTYQACDEPPYVPMTVAVTCRGPSVVEPVNVAVVCPAGTVTVAGTVMRLGYWLTRSTTAPPAGAAACSVTVPVIVWLPPASSGLMTSDFRPVPPPAGGGIGVPAAGTGAAGEPALRLRSSAPTTAARRSCPAARGRATTTCGHRSG